jgi:hypothetical protein
LTVKIGKNFSQFSIKNDDTSEQNLKFLKNFNLLSQIELRESRIDIQGFFGIKSAGSSNYRGACFSAPAKTSQIFRFEHLILCNLDLFRI